MEVIPAIDLRNGKCVRLYQGDYDRETVFSEDPVSMALRWQAEGAKRLHLVDLDGAREGEPRNLEVVKRIVEAVEVPVELGGGIRTLATVEEILGLGVDRVILGTAAVEKAGLVPDACSRFGERIVVGVDAQDGMVATQGWLKKSTVRAVELAEAAVRGGARRLIYTDISRDGTLTAPNFEGVTEMVKHVAVPVIAAGGVTKVEHLIRLAEIGAEGAVVGRAVYTGDLELGEALRAVGRSTTE